MEKNTAQLLGSYFEEDKKATGQREKKWLTNKDNLFKGKEMPIVTKNVPFN
jgi:hypothetical protein